MKEQEKLAEMLAVIDSTLDTTKFPNLDFAVVTKNILAHHGLEPCLTYLLGVLDTPGFFGPTWSLVQQCRMELKKYRQGQPQPPVALGGEQDPIGRTVKGIAWSSDEVLFAFTDGTYWGLCSETTINVASETRELLNWRRMTVEAGLLSAEQYDAMWADWNNKEKARQEAVARQEYERLKAKFEAKPE